MEQVVSARTHFEQDTSVDQDTRARMLDTIVNLDRDKWVALYKYMVQDTRLSEVPEASEENFKGPFANRLIFITTCRLDWKVCLFGGSGSRTQGTFCGDCQESPTQDPESEIMT
jgi:hypothetical protein